MSRACVFRQAWGEGESAKLSVNHIHNQFVIDTKPHKAAVLPEKWLTTFQFVFHVEQTKVIFKVMPWQKSCGYLHESPMDAWGYLLKHINCIQFLALLEGCALLDSWGLSVRIVFLLFAEQQNSLARLQKVSICLLPFPVSELKTAKLNGNTIYPLIFGEICYLLFNHLFHLFFTVFPFSVLSIKELSTDF